MDKYVEKSKPFMKKLCFYIDEYLSGFEEGCLGIPTFEAYMAHLRSH